MNAPRVMIAVPSTDSVGADFMVSVVGMVTQICKTTNRPFGFVNTKGSVICANRTDLVDEALRNNASHILFIDTDMQFPATLLEQLLEHGKPIVAVNYVTKEIPAVPVSLGLDGQRCTSVGKTGLESVKSIGLGGCLIDLEVFRTLPQPWFDNQFIEAEQAFRIEDGCFCENALAHGYEIFIDHDLSQSIGHRGGYTYSWKDCSVTE